MIAASDRKPKKLLIFFMSTPFCFHLILKQPLFIINDEFCLFTRYSPLSTDPTMVDFYENRGNACFELISLSIVKNCRDGFEPFGSQSAGKLQRWIRAFWQPISRLAERLQRPWGKRSKQENLRVWELSAKSTAGLTGSSPQGLEALGDMKPINFEVLGDMRPLDQARRRGGRGSRRPSCLSVGGAGGGKVLFLIAMICFLIVNMMQP